MKAPGATDAAVLLPIFGHPEQPGLVFTERRSDLRRHAGEISFPGGRQDDPAEDLVATALREAEEEIGLDPADVEVVGALPPVGTFVTGYKVHPFVGLIPEGLCVQAEPERGRGGPSLLARRAARRVRDAPPGPPRRPDPHPDLRGRRAPDLGRDGADPRRAAGAAGLTLSSRAAPVSRSAAASIASVQASQSRGVARRRPRPGSASAPPPRGRSRRHARDAGCGTAPRRLVDEAPHRRVDQLLQQALEPRAVDRRDRLRLAAGRAEQPEDQRDVADQVEDDAGAIRVGERRLDPARLDLLGIARIARRPAHRPAVVDQAPAQHPAAAAAADDQRPRQFRSPLDAGRI